MKLQSYFTTNNSTITANQRNIIQIAIAGKSLSLTDRLTTQAKQLYAKYVTAKSVAERGNSTNLYTANNSTPFQYRAFFVCKLRTSKENTFPNFRERTFLSMVGRIGQRLIVGCIPCIAVFHPDMLYRQAWKLAVVPKIFNTELLAMTTYLFAGIVRTDLSNKIHTLRIDANSLLEARAKLAKTYVLVCIGKLPHSRTNQVVEVANV